MPLCKQCGLFAADENKCYWFNKGPSSEELAQGECPYIMEIMKEDGEPLTPLQHLLIKRQDLASKKMQGPV